MDDDEITTCDSCGKSVYVEATATTEDGDSLCPECADIMPDPIPHCEWCGDAVYPGDRQRSGMHLTCWRQGKADYDEEVRKEL